MATKNPLICPYCKIPLNHHAEKEDQSTLEIIEIHTCPKCGLVETRISAS